MNLDPQRMPRAGARRALATCIVCGRPAYSLKRAGRAVSYKSKSGIVRRQHTCGDHAFHSWQILPIKQLHFIDPSPRVPIPLLIKWLEEERERRELFMGDFCELLDITVRTYSAWLNGHSTRPGRGPRQTTSLGYAERLLWNYDRIPINEVIDDDDLIRIPTIINKEP